MFQRAILRLPGSNFADGLTTVDYGTPDYQATLAQHQAYQAALRHFGLELEVLEPDLEHPDSTFVEDVAVLTAHSAILTNPGAPSRKGEVEGIRPAIERHFENICRITAPGTLDGGDICEAGSHFFIGLSERTNPEGARQLAAFLAQEGYSASTVEVKGVPGILHLKSGIAYLGEKDLVLIDAFAGRPEFAGYRIIRVDPDENYAANCLPINESVLIPKGYPRLKGRIDRLGYTTLALDMSEYRKMDGGLSCLSLRF